jgi:parvulin-like peptidyl-prolyl isomerase
MKRDAAIAVLVIAAVFGACYGLANAKLDLKPVASQTSAAPAAAAGNERVVMRVNGEPVTESEFEALFTQLPEEMQKQLQSPQGKQAFAEQMVRVKLLEQEARRLGVDRDRKVAAALAADRANILASAAAQKLIGVPSEQAVQTFYNQNKSQFEAVDVSHILFAYKGGLAPPRPGHPAAAPPEAEARAKARQVVAQLRSGANFANLAAQLSDDVASAQRGGQLGTFSRGMLPPEIEARVLTLKEGEITEPIPSRYGVHIFKGGKRSFRPLEQVRPMIAQRVQEQTTLERLERLRRASKIDFDPKFFPDAKKRS